MACSRAAGSSGLLFGCLLTVILVSGCGQKSPSEKLADVTEPITSPGWIRFKPEANIDARNFLAGYAEALHLPEGTTMRSVSEETDDLGIAHIRHQQYFRGIEVEGAEFLVHARDARALSANGQLATDFAPKTVAARIEETQALETVRRRMGVNAFYDGDRLVEELKGAPSNPSPRGVLLYTLVGSDNRVLAWRFDAYVDPIPNSRRLYVDAETGEIIKDVPLLPSCFTTQSATTFRGNQSFNTAQRNIPGLGTRFVLVDDCHGNELRQQSFNFTSGSSNEVIDSDNNWSNQDMSLVTSFWALGVAYDYFDLQLKRKSFDNKNGNMVIINNPNVPNGGRNAFGGGGAITIGLAGLGPNDDFNTTDIVGHEFTHSVVERTAKLDADVSKEFSGSHRIVQRHFWRDDGSLGRTTAVAGLGDRGRQRVRRIDVPQPG